MASCRPAMDKQNETESQSENTEDQQIPNCITNHPGFEAVCLNKWSLELAAESYKTRGGCRYKLSSSKNR